MASRTAWAGWILFAAIVLMMVGGMDIFQGLVAVFQDEYATGLAPVVS